VCASWPGPTSQIRTSIPALHFTTSSRTWWTRGSVLQALQAATIEPARFYRATDSLGAVSKGYLADLVVLDANPLADITNSTKIRAVVLEGRLFDRKALDAMLEAGKERAKRN
jgi:imidazolonepropionase-like amidohydrolase